MTVNQSFMLLLTCFLLMTACQKEPLVEAQAETTPSVIIGADNDEKTPETSEQAMQRMRAKTLEFFELIGEPTTLPLERTKANAFNSGRLSVLNANVTSNSYDPLNFGPRIGTTQWVSLDLTNSSILTFPDGYTNNRSGAVNFYLSGVNQTVTLNFDIDVRTRRAVIRPSTTASLHSRQIPTSSFIFGGPLKVTIHGNTSGWLWVEVQRSGIPIFSSLYRFNYNTGLNVRNGGDINIFGFGPFMIGPKPPWSPAGFTTNYSGYCGWF